MHKIIKRIDTLLKKLFLGGVLFLTLTGCSVVETESPTQEQYKESIYKISEITIPNPDEALRLTERVAKEDQLREIRLIFHNDTLYRFVQHWVGIDSTENVYEYDYIQILEAPYEQWDSYEVPATYWDKKIEASVDPYSMEDIYVNDQGEVYVRLNYTTELGEQTHIALWSREHDGEIIYTMPQEQLEAKYMMLPDGNFCTYDFSTRYLMRLNERMEVIGQWQLTSQIDGILQNPQSGSVILYGVNEQGFRIWSPEEAFLLEGVQDIGVDNYCCVMTMDGTLYLADKQKIWKYTKENVLEECCQYIEEDYWLEEVYGIQAMGNEGIRLLAKVEGEYCILSLDKRTEPKVAKKEITFATWYLDNNSGIQQAISRFNRQSEEYRVVLLSPEEGQSDSDFIRFIQMEISAGRGPDMLEDTIVDMEDYARNGYLSPLDDVIEDESAFWTAALDSCRVKDTLYGIPFECGLSYAVCSKEMAAGRTSWTMSEMMDIIGSTDAKQLEPELSALEIVLYYGLYDNSNTSLIDWEMGESHLTDAPFIELLEFAREYGDTGKYPQSIQGDMLLKEEIALESGKSWMLALENLNYLAACFEGEPVCIGYPSASGSGIYVSCRKILVCKSSQHEAGCKEFLQFLLSEESQKRYMEYGRDSKGTDVRYSNLSPRLSALEYLIALKRDEGATKDAKKMMNYGNGISYCAVGLNAQQEQRFRYLLETAEPDNWNARGIVEMVSEELAPFFASQRTAQEAAEILHSRVQIYLEERLQ